MHGEERLGYLIRRTFLHDIISVFEYRDTLFLNATTIGIQCQELNSKKFYDAKIEALTIVKPKMDEIIDLKISELIDLYKCKKMLVYFENENDEVTDMEGNKPDGIN